MQKRIILNIIGIIFLAFGIAAIVNVTLRSQYEQVIWFCYIGLVIMGIATLKQNSFWLTSQINILAFPLLFWSFDFIILIATGNSIFGLTDYFLAEDFPLISKIISIQHLFTIPLSIYALYLMKLKRNDAWKISFVQLTALFFVTRIFTSSESNLNCVYRSCFNFTLDFYPIAWFIAGSLMILITNFIIVRFFKNGRRPKN
ncbi:hypothetical protein HYV49_05605 [Candidatus Pacearchaeota archaeon]|nr:hypothetical protein [Candidatus Pacearchaeota archaeon]